MDGAQAAAAACSCNASIRTVSEPSTTVVGSRKSLQWCRTNRNASAITLAVCGQTRWHQRLQVREQVRRRPRHLSVVGASRQEGTRGPVARGARHPQGKDGKVIILASDTETVETPEKTETVATVGDAGPSTGSYIGSPLLWIGVGVGIAAVFSWASGRIKKYAMQQVFKSMTKGMPPIAPNTPLGQPFPYAAPPTRPQQASSPASKQLVDIEALIKTERKEKKAEVPVSPTASTSTAPTSSAARPVFTDVSASTIEEEKTAAAAAAAVNAKQDTHEQKNSAFQEAEVVDNGSAGNSYAGSSSKTSGGKAGNVFTVDALERMMEDPMVQQMVYPYLPEEMRNPATFKWMMQNPQYRDQLQDMLNNMGGDGAWDSRMSDMLKNFDLNSTEVKQQFEQIGLTPQEVVAKIMGNPDVALAFQNPKVQAAIMDCSQNPLNITKYQNDKEVMDVFNKISELFPGMTGAPY